MDSPLLPWFQRLDKSSRRLLCTLMSGHWGALAAFRTLQHSQDGEELRQGFSWYSFTENLCSQQPVLKGPEKTLVLKPVLLLLPVLCQRNLFSLLLTVWSTIPKDCLRCLLKASGENPNPDPWVQRLRDLLQAGLQEKSSLRPVLLSDACKQQLKGICQKIMTHGFCKPSLESKLSWYVNKPDLCLVPGEDASGSDSQIRKNKKVAKEPLEGGVEAKRPKLDPELNTDISESCAVLQEVDATDNDDKFMMEVTGNEDIHNLDNDLCQSPLNKEGVEKQNVSQSLQQDTADEVPDFIKEHVSKLKELLQTHFELESLCSLLHLSTCPENELLHFCTWILSLSPDLGYSNAAVLAEKVFLPRILSLTEPPSWALTTGLMMFCSKYARPVCCTLISSIVQAPKKGLEQMKLVWKLIEECLEPDYVKLVFSHIIKMPWTEDILTVVHALLGRQVELPTELFNKLVLNLCQVSQEFTTSMHYAKLVLTLLTKYQSNITIAQQQRLSCAVDLNKTILKKPLQVALKKVISR
uniref:FA complementation group E n=1 Tax=Salvator merianae TaxID=96440 RepID=A0A8D0AY38_SALMN